MECIFSCNYFWYENKYLNLQQYFYEKQGLFFYFIIIFILNNFKILVFEFFQEKQWIYAKTVHFMCCEIFHKLLKSKISYIYIFFILEKSSIIHSTDFLFCLYQVNLSFLVIIAASGLWILFFKLFKPIFLFSADLLIVYTKNMRHFPFRKIIIKILN